MEQSDRVPPPAAPYGDDPGLEEGYNQDPGYGHNQESFLLHQPHDGDDDAKEPPHRERRRRVSGIGLGLGSAGAAGIPDAEGHAHTGFGDTDRD
ncbi:hypothetical protein [Sinomonas sp. G460-2]|uniref:hypothetical protein n=1 Tax=Sinomonas sp. G460-2 TaxID=3393464 RepID=UPI0039EDF8BB